MTRLGTLAQFGLACLFGGISWGQTFTLTSSPNPSRFGKTVTFTATANPFPGPFQVTFTDQTTGQVLGTNTWVQSGNTGSAIIFYSALPAGPHDIVASYVNFSETSTTVFTPVDTQVVTVPTTITVTTSPNPSTYCDTVTFKATVLPNPGPVETPPPNPTPPTPPAVVSLILTSSGPSGTVSFYDGGVLVSTQPVVNGVATLPVTGLAAGVHSIAATYNGDQIYEASSTIPSPVLQVVNKALPAIQLKSSLNPSTFGDNVTFTAILVRCQGGAVPTGAVTFTTAPAPGNGQLGQAPVVGGSASVSNSTLPVGTDTVNAAYGGDNNYLSNSAQIVQVVGKTTPTVTVSGLPNPSTYGQTVTITAGVVPVTASGQVDFIDTTTNTSLGQVQLTNGQAVITTSTLSAGSHLISVTYGGSPTVSSPPASYNQTVIKRDSSITLQVSPDPATAGGTLTLTATVLPSGATGTVIFREDNSQIGQAVALSAGGLAALSSPAVAGLHSFSATYSGDNTFNSSPSNTVSVRVTVPITTSTTTLTANPTSTVFGQTVSLSASVSPSGTGFVTFKDGGTAINTAPLVGGSADFSTSTLTVGTHFMTADYGGDASTYASTSNLVTVTVGKIPTTTTLSTGPAPSGQGVAVTAHVVPATATGSVTFSDNGVTVGSAPLAAGAAVFPGDLSNDQSHSITAHYTGDTHFDVSTSAPLAVGRTGSTTSLAASSVSPVFGDKVVLTATVSPGSATGTVLFQEGGTTLGSGNLSTSGATFPISTLSGGLHNIVATYQGDTTFLPSTSKEVTLTVAKVATQIQLTVSPNPKIPGTPVTLTGTVTPSAATGTVTFLDGSVSVGSAPLTGGVAVLTIPSLPAANNNLTAAYGGDNNSLISMSDPVAVTSVPPIGNISPTSLPTAFVNVPYSQLFNVTGGTTKFQWSVLSGDVPGITISPDGLLAGTPKTAGTTQLIIGVTDANGLATSTVLSLTVLPQPTITISILAPSGVNTTPLVLIPSYPVALDATFALTFTADSLVKGLPSPYTNPDVVFASGGAVSGTVHIPANSTAAIPIEPLQLGSIAGTITVSLASLTSPGLNIPIPSPVPSTGIPKKPAAPIIVPNSVKITGVTSTGFQVVLTGTTSTRELVGANAVFTAAPGTQLNGTPQTVSLAAATTQWFAPVGTASLAKGNGGNFVLTLPFGFSGDPSSIGTVSVTLTNSNSPGTSTPVSGGR